MQDVLSRMSQMRRPCILLRAAKSGTEDYLRDQHLARIFGRGKLPRHGAALMRLIELEADVDKARRIGDPTYSIVKHVDLLIAMLGEARLLRASQAKS